MALMEEVRMLIKEEDWHNIPAPIRTTCEGIINFQAQMTSSIVWNAENAHKKVISALEKQRRFEASTKVHFEQLEHKFD